MQLPSTQQHDSDFTRDDEHRLQFLSTQPMPNLSNDEVDEMNELKAKHHRFIAAALEQMRHHSAWERNRQQEQAVQQRGFFPSWGPRGGGGGLTGLAQSVYAGVGSWWGGGGATQQTAGALTPPGGTSNPTTPSNMPMAEKSSPVTPSMRDVDAFAVRTNPSTLTQRGGGDRGGGVGKAPSSSSGAAQPSSSNDVTPRAAADPTSTRDALPGQQPTKRALGQQHSRQASMVAVSTSASPKLTHAVPIEADGTPASLSLGPPSRTADGTSTPAPQQQQQQQALPPDDVTTSWILLLAVCLLLCYWTATDAMLYSSVAYDRLSASLNNADPHGATAAPHRIVNVELKTGPSAANDEDTAATKRHHQNEHPSSTVPPFNLVLALGLPKVVEVLLVSLDWVPLVHLAEGMIGLMASAIGFRIGFKTLRVDPLVKGGPILSTLANWARRFVRATQLLVWLALALRMTMAAHSMLQILHHTYYSSGVSITFGAAFAVAWRATVHMVSPESWLTFLLDALALFATLRILGQVKPIEVLKRMKDSKRM